MTLIKNCGLTTPEVVDAAAATGASFVGFVHFERSTRHLPIPEMAELIVKAKAQQKLKTVAVLVNPLDTLLNEIFWAKPDYIQLHDVTFLRLRQIIELRFNIPIIMAISVRSQDDLRHIQDFEGVSEHLLFDAKTPGSGQPFDWSLLTNLQLQKPWFLAGGLTAANVADAIRQTGAPMVDVSSGIEEAPGIKSLEKIAAFNAAVLNA